MSVSVEMPKYKSHKEVWALKIKSIVRGGEDENRESDGSAIITPEEEGYAPFRVEGEYLHKHKPQVGGYYVVYKDGYKSFSPAEAFEEGNTLIKENAPKGLLERIMISQPMHGFTEEQIVETRNRFLEFAEKENLEVVNTYFQDEWYSKDAMTSRGVVQIPLCFLSKSVENMSLCHKAYFAKGWENARGCKIEHEIALQYGLEIIYEA